MELAQRRVLGGVGVCLVVLGGFYLALGFRALLFDEKVAYDLKLRWVDQKYFHNGQNPFDVFFAARSGDREGYEKRTGRDSRPIEGVGVPKDVGYPPWSYPVGSLWFWMDWPAVRWYWAAVNLLAVTAIGVFCWRELGVLGLGVGLACSAYAINLAIGQAAIVVVALIMSGMALSERRPYLAGLLLTMAMFKPTITIPFLLCFALAGRWKAVWTCAAGVLAMSCVTWGVTRTPPWEMLGQMQRAALSFAGLGTGPIRFLIHGGLSPAAAGKLVMAVSVLFAAAGMWSLRGATSLPPSPGTPGEGRGEGRAENGMTLARMLTLAAVAAVGGRFWTYHAVYDDGMLVFLLLWLAGMARREDSWPWFAAFVLVGISLWMPGRLYTPGRFAYAGWVQAYQQLAWTAGAILVVATARRSKRSPMIAP